MRDLLRAEWLKGRTGKAWWVLLAVGVPWILLVCLGVTTEGTEQLEQGTTDAAALTTDLVKQWFQMLLFSALFGAVFVCREYGARTIGRSVLLSGARRRLLWAKAIVGTVVGALYGALAAILAVAAAWFFLVTSDVAFTWTRETTLTLVGVFAVSVLAAPWGVFVGWVMRNQAAAIAFLLFQILLVEPGIQHFAPRFSGPTFSIALSSIYRDGKPELLSVPWAAIVVVLWLAAAAVAARVVFATRDVQ